MLWGVLHPDRNHSAEDSLPRPEQVIDQSTSRPVTHGAKTAAIAGCQCCCTQCPGVMRQHLSPLAHAGR